MNIKNIIIGIIIVIAGVIMVIKKEWFLNNIGRINFFEEKIGTGSSRLGYQLIGIIAILIGALVISNLWGDLLMGTFGSLFSGLKT